MRRLFAGIGASLAVLSASTIAHAEERHLPNLVPVPPHDIIIGEADPPEDPDEPVAERAVRFTTLTYNRGEHALDLTFAPAGIEDALANGREILQCDRFVNQICIRRASAGRATFHAPHGHWHVEDYASYTLVPVTTEGLPDFDAEPVAPGVKASFCLIDSHSPDEPHDTLVGYNNCDNVRQGISPGFGDAYGPGLPGQQIVIDDIEPGIYGLVIEINPIGRLYETTRSDNRSWAVIDLGAEPAEDGSIPVLATGVS